MSYPKAVENVIEKILSKINLESHTIVEKTIEEIMPKRLFSLTIRTKRVGAKNPLLDLNIFAIFGSRGGVKHWTVDNMVSPKKGKRLRDFLWKLDFENI